MWNWFLALLDRELTRLLLLDGGEVGVPHEGDQVGEEHPVLWSHQVDVHNLRKIYVDSEVVFARQFWPVGLSRSSSWPARRSSSWTQPHFWHCHDWIPANGRALRGYFDLKWPTITFRLSIYWQRVANIPNLEPVQEVESEEEEGWREDKSICENPEDSRGQAAAWEQPGETMFQQAEVNPTKFLYMGQYSEMSLWMPSNW